MSEKIVSTYEIIGKLGAGGGGIVYLANHLRLDKRVVLKADKRSTNTRVALLRREVDVLKELSQTYIPQVYDYFIEDDISYTVMDYVDGESLDKVLAREKKIPQAKVIHWARQLLEALAYLHSPTHGDPPRGYVHSDVKPANIMVRPNGDICLIDFNISLAMGVESIIGKSDGYSSPEYYGFDYAVNPLNTNDKTEVIDDKTEIVDDKTVLQTGKIEAASASQSGVQSSSVKRVLVPDARSDIYSVGATLYHLLSGHRPDKDARKVVPLSYKEFSPLLCDIIAKAMRPDPAERFHTADEMLQALNDLWKNDPRVRRQKKCIAVGSIILSTIFAASTLTVFAGLKQMERLQAAHVIASESAEILASGDAKGAADRALDALLVSPGMFDIPYTAEAQLALTNALGVYDLSDSFKPYGTIELPSAPFRMIKSPDGTKLAVCYAYELAIYDIGSGAPIKSMPTLESAMCEVEFIGDTKVVFAGESGLTAYDIASDTVLWQGEPATAIALSGDKSTVAAINGKDKVVNIYDVGSGELISFRELDGRHLNIPENDNFADSCRDVFELNYDGSMCAVSLTGGHLVIMDIFNVANDLIIYDESDNIYFDGKFLDDIFAFSAAGNSGALFGIVDWKNAQYLGDMQGNTQFKIMVYNDELYVSQNDTAIKINTEDFSQTEAAYTENKNITAWDISDKYIISAADDGYSVFLRGATIMQTGSCDVKPDFVQITDNYAVIANRNSPTIEILKFKDYGDACIMEYDPTIIHSEARILADRSGVMLFSINDFTLLDSDGNVKKTVKLPESDKIYDQQYHHDGDYLEVIYYSGKTVCYSAETGDIISESAVDPPDDSLGEEFETADYLIKAPLHGVPMVYDKQTGEKIAELNNNDYLTYITETDKYIVAQYISTEGRAYGVLMNKKCEPIAQLPYLCDVADNMLIYDFPAGNIKMTPIYELDELRQMAENNWD